MLAVEKWAMGKPYFLGLLAPQMATTAQDLHLGFSDLKKRRLGEYQFPLPHLPSWFQLYRTHKRHNQFLRILLSEFSPFGSFGVDASDAFLEYSRRKKIGQDPLLEKPTQSDIEEATRALETIQVNSFKDLTSEFDGEPIDPEQKAEALSLIEEMDIEASFFILVAAPCWLLYRESATRLYRKARLGNIDALEKLLRLDALLIHDPAIGKQVQAFRFKNKFSTYQFLFDAVFKKPKNKLTRKRMKYAIAGLISAISSLLKHPLTEPEIRDLFDAVQKDMKKDPFAIDHDLPLTPEAFTRAIHRDRAFWIEAFHPDRKI